MSTTNKINHIIEKAMGKKSAYSENDTSGGRQNIIDELSKMKIEGDERIEKIINAKKQGGDIK